MMEALLFPQENLKWEIILLVLITAHWQNVGL
jgi:hypothetical protein